MRADYARHHARDTRRVAVGEQKQPRRALHRRSTRQDEHETRGAGEAEGET